MKDNFYYRKKVTKQGVIAFQFVIQVLILFVLMYFGLKIRMQGKLRLLKVIKSYMRSFCSNTLQWCG